MKFIRGAILRDLSPGRHLCHKNFEAIVYVVLFKKQIPILEAIYEDQ